MIPTVGRCPNGRWTRLLLDELERCVGGDRRQGPHQVAQHDCLVHVQAELTEAGVDA